MPNWCSNFVSVSHEDPEVIQELANAMEENRFFEYVVPVPPDLKETTAGAHSDQEEQQRLEEQTARNLEKYGYGNWFDFCVARWGTKWEVECEGTVEISEDGLTVTASFDSAWSPPLAIYEELVDDGYSVRAYYYEPGMAFAGIWDNGSDDCYQEWGDSNGAKDMLPQELDEYYAISESQREWELDDMDDLQRWIVEATDDESDE